MISDAASYQNTIKSISLKYGLVAIFIEKKLIVFNSTLDYILERGKIAEFPATPCEEWDCESIENRIVEGCMLNGF